MTKRWRFIVAGIVAMALGFLCVDSAQAKYVESKTLTLALNIEKHYEVAFNANGGTGTMANQQFTAGTAQALTANAYANGSLSFVGWNTRADGQGTAYTNRQMINADLTNIGGDVVTLYAQWGSGAMQTVFEIDGECVFHGYDIQMGTGDGHITGTNCVAQGVDWADGTHKYIDTGVKLYDSTNYEKDYEVGLTVTAYDYNNQYKEPGTDSQATFFNAKLENPARHWPGLTVRKNKSKIEVTQTITKPNGSYEKKTTDGTSTTPVKIVVTRVNGVVYYSFNGGKFTSLQDINNTSDYFDVNAWFGAAAKDDGNPFRYIDATLTDMYIKVGNKNANKQVVSFDAGGIVADPADFIAISDSSSMGTSTPSMPNYVDTESGRLYFIGWFTEPDGEGDKYTEDTIIEHDVTLYAYWDTELVVCRVDNDGHATLQDCIDLANSGSTITLLDNIKEQVSIAAGADITLDLSGFKIGDNAVGGQPVIANNGKLTIKDGTITSSLGAGVINNNSTGELYVQNGARIVATGSRQAVYNDGGKLVISGNAYLSAATNQRAAVQSKSSGTLIITGGTIISKGSAAVRVESGTATIGVKDGVIDKTTPILQGATWGLDTGVDVAMYDGTLRGKTNATNNTAHLTVTEVGATPVGIDPVVTEVIDGDTYKIIYYQ